MVKIPMLGQRSVDGRSVRVHPSPGGDRAAHKREQVPLGGHRHALQPDPTEALWLLHLNRDRDQSLECLALTPRPLERLARVTGPHIRLIAFDPAASALPIPAPPP